MTDRGENGGGRRSTGLEYASVGFEVVVPIVLFMFAGYKLDGWLDRQPWFLLGGALLGIAVGFYNLFRRLLPLLSGGKKEE